MKGRVFWLALAAMTVGVFGCVPAWCQMNFEGTLVYKIHAEGDYLRKVDSAFADTLRVYVRGGDLLTEFSGRCYPSEWIGRMLIRSDSSVIYKLLDSLRIAQRQKIDLESSPFIDYSRIKLAPSPKMEKIAGYECRRYTGSFNMPMIGGECRIELWLWEDFRAPGAPEVLGIYSTLGGVPNHKGVVLKKRLTVPALKLTVTQTCVSAQFKMLPAKMFEIPSDYVVGEYFPLDELPSRAPAPPKKKLDVTPFRLDKKQPKPEDKPVEEKPSEDKPDEEDKSQTQEGK